MTENREIRLWHDSPRGLGARIKPTGVATFFVQYLSPETGRKTRLSIGQFGRITVEEAVREARKVFAGVVGNEDPARVRRRALAEAKLKARTIRELCDQYMKDADAGLVTYRGRAKKASTLAIDRGRIKRHILPLLGDRLVQDIMTRDVDAFFHAVRRGETATTERTGPRGVARVTGGATTASRTVDLLGSLFSYAIRHELRPDNPVSRFERPVATRRDRALTPDEYRRLGLAFGAMKGEGANLVAIAAFEALALTGCRRNEILRLQMDQVDTHRQVLRLADTKTGRQLRPVGKAALVCIAEAMDGFAEQRQQGRNIKQPDPGFVFPGNKTNSPLVGVKLFGQATRRAQLSDVSLHTLRHSFASVALELGYSELTIGGILGHKLHSVTSRYAHHVDHALVSAANTIAARVSGLMTGTDESAEIVEMRITERRN